EAIVPEHDGLTRAAVGLVNALQLLGVQPVSQLCGLRKIAEQHAEVSALRLGRGPGGHRVLSGAGLAPRRAFHFSDSSARIARARVTRSLGSADTLAAEGWACGIVAGPICNTSCISPNRRVGHL